MAFEEPKAETAMPRPDEIFHCKRCNACCEGYGGTFLTQRDIEAISEFVGVQPKAFVETYCRVSGKKLVIAQGEDGFCVFLKAEGCGIHPVKPRMCRAWPFIESVVKAPENWRIMAGACPGMRTDFPDEAVAACVSRVLARRNLAP